MPRICVNLANFKEALDQSFVYNVVTLVADAISDAFFGYLY